MKYQYFFSAARDHDLNEIVAGHPRIVARRWEAGHASYEIPAGSTGVLWRTGFRQDVAQPLVLVVEPAELRRLFGRFAQLRSDLSPLTTWCHLLTASQFEKIDSLTRDSDLDGWEAAWTGLIVAEALLRSERSIVKLRLSACQATQSFAVARTLALWGGECIPEVLQRFVSMQRLLRSSEPPVSRLTIALEPIWSSLTSVAGGDESSGRSELTLLPIGASLSRLRELREAGNENEADAFVEPLKTFIPEVEALKNLAALTPEERLLHFDSFVSALAKTAESNTLRRTGLALLAGYLSTVAAGGAPSLGLAERHASQWPEITAWAYAVGGIAEHVVWTASFDGLGRLVARELMRPLRLDEPPTCDFALEEAQMLVDTKLQDPLVHLRIKQGRVLSVSIFPGVNAFVSLLESPANDSRKLDADRRRPGANTANSAEPLDQSPAAIAEAIWPHLQRRVEQAAASCFERLSAGRLGSRSKTKKKGTPGQQTKLWARE